MDNGLIKEFSKLIKYGQNNGPDDSKSSGLFDVSGGWF